MEIEYSSHFKRAYQKLDIAVQKKAERKEILFQKNPFSTTLETHKLHGKLKGFCSFSVDSKFRIVFKFITGKKVIFLDVGDHDVYR